VGLLPHFKSWCLHQHLNCLHVGFFFFFQVFFTPSSWPLSYSNSFTISGKWFKWISFIHITSLWWKPLYFTKCSLPLKHVCFAQNMPLILTINLCSMASTSSYIFCYHSSLWSSYKNNLSFETWKVRCAIKLVGNFGVYMLGCDLWKVS